MYCYIFDIHLFNLYRPLKKFHSVHRLTNMHIEKKCQQSVPTSRHIYKEIVLSKDKQTFLQNLNSLPGRRDITTSTEHIQFINLFGTYMF